MRTNVVLIYDTRSAVFDTLFFNVWDRCGNFSVKICGWECLKSLYRGGAFF